VWFLGYTPQIAAAVWVGDPRGGYRYPMRNVVVNGSYYGEVFGATLPAPIWRQAMAGAHEDLPIRDFGGGPDQGWLNLDLGDDKAKTDKPGGGGAGQRQQDESNAQPDPAQEESDSLGDYATDLLENLPDFDFGN
jgi:membrane peptidoglycan carboxypeptidase